ncbi:MAG TPA: alpha/beta hydrolase [Acidimicrobiales bacterium]
MPARSPSHTVALGGGRVAAVDEAGDPAGVPVLYLHGTPDSRLARHPDDGLAAAAGVRLLALDRPGYGHSSPPAGHWSPGWPAAAAADVDAVLGALGVERCAVLAWSGGALTGLALAAGAERVAGLGIASGLVPREAYDEPEVAAAAPDRLGMLELAAVLPAGELGADVAPLLAPHPCDPALAAEHQAGHREPHDAAELAGVPGATERMAEALVEAVRGGLAGVAADVEAQARPLGLDLDAVARPVRLWYGARDTVTPPAFGRWYAGRLPRARLDVVDGAGHYLVFAAWERLLGEAAALAA